VRPTRGHRSTQSLLDKLVLSAFVDATPRSRAQLVAETGLSRAVTTGVLTQLLAAGELTESEETRTTGSRGRPATLYQRTALSASVDFIQLDKGQVTRAAVVSDEQTIWADDGNLAQWSAPWEHWNSSLLTVFAKLHQDAGLAAASDVIVAAPFPVTDGNGAPRLHERRHFAGFGQHSDRPHFSIPDWLATDPRPRIAAAWSRPAQLINDANLAALGEASYGAGRGDHIVLYLLVRDGIGAGLVINGQVITGAHGMTGELAHVQVADDGPFCLCGNRGCMATQTQDPRLVKVLSSRYARPVQWPDVEQLVTNHDVVALRVLRDLGRLVGQPLATIVTMLDPDSIIVDGTLGPAAAPFIEGLHLELDHRCPPTIAAGVRIQPGVLNDPVTRGAFTAATLRRRTELH
jgi:predicted NBD/HSP70 family sugar kinase